MRCDTQVYFVTDGEKTMVTDPASPNYGGYEEAGREETGMLADVTDTQASIQQLVYGRIREAARTVRLNRQYLAPFDHIRIVDRDTGMSALYDVDAARHLRHRSVFICHERR